MSVKKKDLFPLDRKEGRKQGRKQRKKRGSDESKDNTVNRLNISIGFKVIDR